MKLYKHKTSRDTAFSIVHEPFRAGFQYVAMYNVNWAKITGEIPAFLGVMEITVKPVSEYEVITYVK